MNELTPTPQTEEPVTPLVVEQKPSRGRMMVLILLVAVLLIVGLAYSLTRSDKPASPVATDTPLTSETAQETAQVNITAQGFSPATIKIKQGTTVTWTNTDAAAHSLKSDVPGLETDEALNQNDQFSFMFETLGTFTVYDAGNPELKNVVEVE